MVNQTATMSKPANHTHYRVCNFCEAMCGIEVQLTHHDDANEPDINVTPDKNDPFSKGSMCPKAPVLSALQSDPDRLRYPVKRVGTDWVEISWAEAYAMVEENIKRIRDQHGPDAIASYLGNPIVHNMGMMLFVKKLTAAIGSKNVFSATSMDQLPHHFAAHFMFGHEFRIPVPDVDRTDFMIIMGANPIASNGSIMTSAGIRERLKEVEARGGQFVVLDPRETETAKIASAHHFIRPGTDVYFLLAFLHVLYRDKHINPGPLAAHVKGLEFIESIKDSVTPLQAEAITGVAATVIEQLVTAFTDRDKSVLYGRMGLSTQRHGGLCHWLINTINFLSGNFDTPGGMMFPTPAIELARGRGLQDRFGRWKSRVRQMPEFYGELPVSAMTEELTTTGEGQVKAFMTICGNPVLSTPGGNRLDDALPDIEFMFSIDNYINETTRHADLIMPTPSGLEVEHYDLIFNLISVSNNVKYSEALLPPAKDRPYDWQVLKELISRLSPSGPGMLHRLETPRRVINWGLMLGAYGRLSHPKRWFSGLTLNKIIKSKHGISLGPLVPRVPSGLLTPDKKIDLAPEVFRQRFNELLAERADNSDETADLKVDEAGGSNVAFRLIGRRHVSTNNSWMHQFHKLSRSRQVRCTAMISSIDAERLSIVDEDEIKVSSSKGSIILPAEVTASMMPGVICIPHGFGHTRSGTRIPNAEAKPGVSVNDITDHEHVDPMTGNAAFSGLPLTVEKISTDRNNTQSVITGKPLMVLFGSRTGNAEFTAQDVAKRAVDFDLIAEPVALDDISVDDLVNAERILIVCSTYGEGDLPDNAQALWDTLNAADAPRLDKSHFSVLALGDRSYSTFCEAGKQWDHRLQELGATRIADRVDCDVDYFDLAEQWMESVLPVIGAVGDQEVSITKTHNAGAQRRYDRNNPFQAQLVEKYRLTEASSSKVTHHYTLSIAGASLSYNVGDTLNVLPVNQESLVHELLALANCDGSEHVAKSSKTLHELLLTDLEIRTPSPLLIDTLAERSPDASVRDALSGTDQELRQSYLWGKDTVDLLAASPGVIDSAEALCDVLRPLTPRSYSISSSINCHPDEVHLTVASVRYRIDTKDYAGVASGYLADLTNPGDAVSVYFAPNNSFSLPKEDDVPVIMIGPGTGVAPFRGFLQEREHRNAVGKNWLFFGDRNKATDFLYRDELNKYLQQGLLTKLDLAFSRDQEQKIYVQDRLRENAAELFQWLQQGAYVYVCGDAEHMAADVDSALHNIVEEQAEMTSSAAIDYIDNLRKSKRYLLDVY